MGWFEQGLLKCHINLLLGQIFKEVGMKLDKFGRFTAAVLLITAVFTIQAAEVWSESFETDGQGVRYTSTAEFTDGGGDYWMRTDGVGLPISAGGYSAMDGTYFWAAEDVDGEGGTKEPELNVTGIDINGFSNLSFSGLFAAGNEGGPGAGKYDSTDYMKVQYQIDGGGYVDGVCFNYENNGDSSNEPIGLDADCDGESDGVSGRLNSVFTEYGFTIAATGGSLDLKVIVSVDAGDEELAFDYLVVSGDFGVDSPPAVTTTIPADGAVGVAENATVTINFSEDINATSSAVTMGCGTSGSIAFASGLPASAVSQLVLTPSATLVDGETCDVSVVATEITDIDGTPDNMAINYDFSFLVGYPTAEIYEIQGSGMASGFDGQTVKSPNNIVTVLSDSGFFMQTPDARDDLDDLTSNGIFVYTGGAPTVQVGDEVTVTGEIDEFFGFTEFANPGSQIIITESQGNALPAAKILDQNYPSTVAGEYPCGTEAMGYECVEGMWFVMPEGVISSSYSSYWVGANRDDFLVKAGASRAFRETGIEFPGEPGLPIFDGNPELLEVDVSGLGFGVPTAGYNAGAHVTMFGVFGFDFNEYELWPSVVVVTKDNVLPDTTAPAAVNELTIGSLNMYRLFNDVDDPGSEDDGQVEDPQVYAGRLAKFAKYIVNDMQAPHIVALQEVENIDVMNDLAAAITAQSGLIYTTALIEGNDQGGIDVGYLYNASVVTNVQITQLGAAEINPYDNSLLHDRPPLQLSADIVLSNHTLAIQVLNVHLRSMGGIDDPGNGDRVRNKRLSQAQSLSVMIADIQSSHPGNPVYVLGDFNAFQFTDGYVDVMGQITGTAIDADNMLWAPPLFAANPLTNATQTLMADEQYSFLFGGSAQALDHAVLDDIGLLFFKEMNYVRGQADAPLQYENDYNSSLRAGDHDGFVLYVSPELDVIFKNGFE